MDDVCVLRVDTPGFNFEIAAAIAMRQWRYKPALQDGRPVDVYFIIKVNFSLLQ
ncbi:MAG: energy transducer TonB [Acidobacteriota bacterium]